jgi:hypothetical protein
MSTDLVHERDAALHSLRDRSSEYADVFTLHEYIVKSRDRLAELPTITSREMKCVALAMHEVIWLLFTPPRGAKTDLDLSARVKGDLLRAARDRSIDLYVVIIAALAVQIANAGPGLTASEALTAVNEHFDHLTFDFRATKKDTIEILKQLRAELDARIAYVRAVRKKRFRFDRPPERYKARKDRRETPPRFFERVYGAEVARGLTQADLRNIDPAFYNVLHVWCSRHKKRMADLIPASRPRAH